MTQPINEMLREMIPVKLLGAGEKVIVLTTKGREMGRGMVIGIASNIVTIKVTPDGDMISNPGHETGRDGDAIRLYDGKLYRFALDSNTESTESEHATNSLGETGGEDGKESKETVPNEETPDSKEKVQIGDKDVDVDDLPKAVQKKIKGISDLDGNQMDEVMSSISESAVTALKKAGVKDSQVYETVVDIQKAVRMALKKG